MSAGRAFTSAAIVSYRLGGLDGVSVEAAKWAQALAEIGLEVQTVAGAGPVDHVVEGLDLWSDAPVDEATLTRLLDPVDVVVAENIASLPINPRASRAVARALAGRPAVLRHHDLPWQRPGLGGAVPDDRRWAHVTVNHLSRRELAQRGIRARTLPNRFEPHPPAGDRAATRGALGLDPAQPLVLQPTRAIARKNLPGALALAQHLGAVLWVTGPTEEAYQPELDRLVSESPVPFLHRPAPADMAGAYAAADAVVMASHWEGFGNPPVEASAHRRPVVVGPYPVARELRALGFDWADLDGVVGWEDVVGASAHQAAVRLETNAAVVQKHLSLADLPEELAELVDQLAAQDSRGRSGPGLR